MATKSVAFLLVSFSIFPFLVAAQHDYVVIENGDTVYGKINKNLFGVMRIVSGKDKIEITDDLRGYYISRDSASYHNIEHPLTGGKVFMQVIAKGEINLYSHLNASRAYNGTPVSTTDWYIEKKGAPLRLLKSSSPLAGEKKDRKNILQSLIADKPEILKMYEENDSFTFNNIRKLINEYNKLMPLTSSNQ